MAEVSELIESPRILYEVPRNKVNAHIPIMVAIPTTGLIRFEWHLSSLNVLVPVAMSIQKYITHLPFVTPIGFHVAEARNICVDSFLQSKAEWLFFIDHDVLLHPMTYSYMLRHMLDKKYPIIAGLYYTKGNPSVPLIFRGRSGLGVFTDFSVGDIVEVDAVPMGCTVIHRSLLEHVSRESVVASTMDGRQVREVFRTPRDIFIDPETNKLSSIVGTEDLHFCSRVLNEGVLKKTGWEEKEFPFVCDTRIFCGHITQEGKIYPDFNPMQNLASQ